LPTGKELFASSWSLESARWEVATGKKLASTSERFGRHLIRTTEGLRSLACEDFRRPHEITVYDPVAGKQLQTIHWADPKKVGINGLRSYTLTADGRTLLVVHGTEPGEKATSHVTACDAASGRRISHFSVPGNLYFTEPPFSPCGRWVVLGGNLYHVGSGA